MVSPPDIRVDLRSGILAGLLAAGVLLSACSAATAAELEGITMPDTQTVGGTELRLNGIALRTFSWFRIKIYVAALYLERATHNAETVLRSAEKKLIRVRFLRDVDAGRVRDAWQHGFERNCRPPCRLDPGEVALFLSHVPAMRAGDETTLVFAPEGLQIAMNGRVMGRITDRAFASVVLTTFMSPDPPEESLREGLLGLGE